VNFEVYDEPWSKGISTVVTPSRINTNRELLVFELIKEVRTNDAWQSQMGPSVPLVDKSKFFFQSRFSEPAALITMILVPVEVWSPITGCSQKRVLLLADLMPEALHRPVRLSLSG
jgi:hypothetical protein